MSYVLVGILLLLLAGAFIAYLVMTAARRSNVSDAPTPGVGADESPFGDTTQHAGEQAGGVTVGKSDADEAGGTGRPVDGAESVGGDRPPAASEPSHRFQRDPVGGEAEARPYTEKGA
jgi:hypothetical protein